MVHIASFIPYIENYSNYDEFDYLFGCQSPEADYFCAHENNECPVTLQ